MELKATVSVNLLMRKDETAEEANSRLADILCELCNREDHHIDFWVEESFVEDETEEPKEIDCDECGRWLVRKNAIGIFYASSDYMPGWTTCQSCMIEHCCTTKCEDCKRSNKVPCDLLSMKNAYMEMDDEEQSNC